MEIQNMTFFGIEPFEAPKTRTSSKNPSVSVTVSKDRITIPNGTFDKFGKPAQVEVGFNDTKRFFAIKAVERPTKYSIEISGVENHQITRKVISDKIYTLHPWDRDNFNIVLDLGQHDEESGYWLFDLDCAKLSPCRKTFRKARRSNHGIN